MRSGQLLATAALLVFAAQFAFAQNIVHGSSPAPDSDRDGMDDGLEQSLLVQFEPTFMVGERDCANVPAEFQSGVQTPTALAENGTIYGQVFPSKLSTPDHPEAEVHFYHLWDRDCGPHGHHLDTEHVAVLVEASDSDLDAAKWTALYWYAAAHENTVCDASQIARASTLNAQKRGAKIWISPGKHASYLNAALCQGGCGADKCVDMKALPQGRIVNLGERGHPMNGSDFIASTEWPLASKMADSNFPPAPIARLEALPDSDIAWFNSGRHPAQRIISVSGSTEEAIANSGENTTSALSAAGDSTDAAISVAGDSTGNALEKSYKHTAHALSTSVRHIGQALHVTEKPQH
jgi:hypothetical protein